MLLITTEPGIVTIIIPSRLISKLEGITVDHLCGFGRHSSTDDHIMSAGQILEKKCY